VSLSASVDESLGKREGVWECLRERGAGARVRDVRQALDCSEKKSASIEIKRMRCDHRRRSALDMPKSDQT
jgi:hypothetical protein